MCPELPHGSSETNGCPRCGRTWGNIKAPHFTMDDDPLWCVADEDMEAFMRRNPDAVVVDYAKKETRASL